MALPIVYTIEPNPHWVIIDNFSKLPDGAAIYTYRSLNPSQFKPAFQDAAGNVPYGQPIVGFGNGTMPPIFWAFDPNNPTETYYIRVYDSADAATQQFLWDFDGLSGSTGGGGGTIITATDLENLITNNVFYRNIGQQLGSPSLSTLLTIAPSNNAGYVGESGNPNGSPAPDITFQKSNTNCSDSLNFVNFTLGSTALSPDVTPQQYFEYACTAVGSGGETYKYVQFPISQGVQSLSQQPVSVKIYGQCNSGNNIVTLSWRQFYGDGGGSAEVITPAGASLIFTNTWETFSFQSTIPNASGKTIGSCGNDGLFLLVGLPLNAATSIDFVKPAVYVGAISPGIDYDSNDQIDSIISLPRTGDIRTSLNSFLPGWVVMNDGTIGDLASLSALSSRANIDTFPLFNLIWSLFNGSPALQALAPMYASGTTTPAVAYGASAIADFIANRQISLTKEAGRVMAGVSGSHLIGTTVGSETHTLTIAELAAHDHPGSAVSVVNGAGGASNVVLQAGGASSGNVSVSVATQGTSTPFSILQPTVYMNVFIKL